MRHAGFVLARGALGAAVVFLSLALLSAPRAEAGVAVTRWTFATKVVAKEPVGAASRFPSDVGTLYFFTQVTGGDRTTELLHVWIYDGREVAILPVDVQGSPWRTWSVRAVGPEQKGDWTVEVREVGGKVLAAATCRIE